MIRDNFAVFILAHGRPDKLYTVDTLKKVGYTGKWYIILDDEDKTIDGYKERFGEEHCIVFSKEEAAKRFDVMDTMKERNVIVFARNMCNDIARDLGLKYFAEFEDDYHAFSHRVPDGESLRVCSVTRFDEVCEFMLNFLDDVSVVQPNLRTIAWAQAGEMQGGVNGYVWKTKVKRKAMNTFFFKVPDDPKDDIKFIGRMNDDVNSYIQDGKTGGLWFQIPNIALVQSLTQRVKGGNAVAYKKFGTYLKSFYSVMLRPDCVKVSVIGEGHPRIHHKIYWQYAVPKIVSEKWQKK